jgi:hypothetical protein
MWSDGSVSSGECSFKLGFKSEDQYILEYFSNILYCGVDRVKKDGDDFSVLYVSSIEMTSKLISLGCIPNKTFKTRFPEWLEKDLQRHFIRGLVDGDGCISISSKNKPVIDFTGTIELIHDIEKILKDTLDVDISIDQRHKDRDNNIYALRIYGFNKIKKFLDWIYKDATIYFKRKYNKYIQFLDIFAIYEKEHYTIEEIQNICELYIKYNNYNQVAQELGINSGTIYKILKRNNKIDIKDTE